jgi:hypothetical protein
MHQLRSTDLLELRTIPEQDLKTLIEICAAPSEGASQTAT